MMVYRARIGLTSMNKCIPLLSRGLGNKPVLGCGSNVVDHIYNVRVIPNAGEKGFFLNPFKAIDKKLIGGVTLNHLCWASLGGVHTGLLALQGEDELGYFIRNNLKKLKVETSFIKADSRFSTSQCHVFIQEGGERSIVMAPASTSLIDSQAVAKYFDDDIQKSASMVTTEISQVPLSGVLALLKSARKANVMSVLDLDVPPNVALKEAKLGTMKELVECVKCADVLKPAHAVVDELLHVLTGGKHATESTSLHDIAKKLIQECGSKLLAITNGGEGSILATSDNIVEVGAPSVSQVVDTTGAGDAYLGGLIVGIKSYGMPQTEKQLGIIGAIANAYGAACTQSVGGVPVKESHNLIKSFLPDDVTSSLVEHDKTLTSTYGTNEVPSSFSDSVNRDCDGIRGITKELDPGEVKRFLDMIQDCEGQVFLSGIGKSGNVAQRFAGSLSSIGIPSQFVHATEWGHGDLGKIRSGRDMVLFISHSGNTEENIAASKLLVERGITTLAITGNKESMLNKLCTGSLTYPCRELREPFGCLPTTSLVIQDVMLNAVISELIDRKGIVEKTFKSNHPGGSIGTLL